MSKSGSGASFPCASRETIDALARSLDEYEHETDAERAILALLQHRLKDPIERLKLQSARARFNEEEEAILRSLEGRRRSMR